MLSIYRMPIAAQNFACNIIIYAIVCTFFIFICYVFVTKFAHIVLNNCFNFVFFIHYCCDVLKICWMGICSVTVECRLKYCFVTCFANIADQLNCRTLTSIGIISRFGSEKRECQSVRSYRPWQSSVHSAEGRQECHIGMCWLYTYFYLSLCLTFNFTSSFYSGRATDTETTKAAREANHAVHAILASRLGQCENQSSRP